MKKQSRPPLARMYAIDEQLRNHRFPNCSSLSSDFEVCDKTIRRDIEYMRVMLGAPIEYDYKRKGFFYEKEWLFLPATFLKEREAEAIRLTKSVLRQYEGSPYYGEISTALDKVLESLPDTIPDDLFFNVYSFEASTRSPASQRIFSEIEEGIRLKRKVRILYDAPTTQKVTRRTIRPYRIHFANDTWYLIAWCEMRKEIRAFVISRMREAALLGETFVPERGFDPDEFIAGMFFQQVGPATDEVAIHFAAATAPWIRERRWHASQRIEEHEDGSLTLSMRVSSMDAVVFWILGYSDQATVLQPGYLRDMVRDSALRIAALYPSKGKK